MKLLLAIRLDHIQHIIKTNYMIIKIVGQLMVKTANDNMQITRLSAR